MASLRGAQIISTGPFKAQRFGWSAPFSHEKKWMNNIDNIRVWRIQIWMGCDIMGRGDFWFRVERISDGNPLGHNNWDHYNEPSGASDNLIIYDYAPNWFVIDKGDGLRLLYGMRRWNPIWPPIMRGDIAVTIFYTSETNA